MKKRPYVCSDMQQQLAAFKKRHGHCNVPADFPGNPRLGRWVAVQRYKRRIGEM